jgi:hypothetical protein
MGTVSNGLKSFAFAAVNALIFTYITIFFAFQIFRGAEATGQEDTMSEFLYSGH